MRSTFTSQRSAGVDSSGIRRMFDLAAKMTDPINLSIGLPDFDVPAAAKTAAIDAINVGINRYTPTQGVPRLRDALRQQLSAEYAKDVSEVLVTSGVSGGLMLAIMATVDPGDEVIYLDPYFVMYKHLLTMAGGVGVAVDSYPDFHFPADRVEAAVTPQTKVLILNSPSNPTGVVMTEAEIRAAVDIARKHNLLIISDEIYEPFLYDRTSDSGSAATTENKLYSPLSIYENTVALRGFSKSHAMTGWRVGYAYGQPDVVTQMMKLQQYTFVCAPAPFQEAATAALAIDMSSYLDEYRAKRDTVCAALSPAFEVNRPGGAFYVFAKVPNVESATSFAERAIAANVLVIPGSVFSGRDTHFRISFATSDEKLRAGCEALNALVNKPHA